MSSGAFGTDSDTAQNRGNAIDSELAPNYYDKTQTEPGTDLLGFRVILEWRVLQRALLQGDASVQVVKLTEVWLIFRLLLFNRNVPG